MVSREELQRAAELLRSGELVAFPTETVYGLGANALDEQAVERIYTAKGRPPTSPLIVHVDGVEMARRLVTEWPETADALATRFWPGPLTLVLKKSPQVPDRVTAALPTVALRMPSHPVALALIHEAGIPIAAPSANRFTELSPTTAEHVRAGLSGAAAMILDGGPAEVGIESTVLSLAGGRPVLLRPGMISQTEIEAVIGPILTSVETGGAHPSPGMHERHYRPRTPLLIGAPPASGKGAHLWIRQELPAQESLAMPDDPATYAARLYDVLHRLDRAGLDFISVEMPPDTPAWAGIRDRLQRAAEKE